MTDSKDTLDSKASVAPPPKRKYQSPTLSTYGKVAALTGQASCAAPNDSSKSCSSGVNRAMVQTSDRSVKENIVQVGRHPLGIGIYLFDYKPDFRDAWGHGRQFGVMADEVEAVKPEAVFVHPDGYKRVDYSALGIERFVQ